MPGGPDPQLISVLEVEWMCLPARGVLADTGRGRANTDELSPGELYMPILPRNTSACRRLTGSSSPHFRRNRRRPPSTRSADSI